MSLLLGCNFLSAIGWFIFYLCVPSFEGPIISCISLLQPYHWSSQRNLYLDTKCTLRCADLYHKLNYLHQARGDTACHSNFNKYIFRSHKCLPIIHKSRLFYALTNFTKTVYNSSGQKLLCLPTQLTLLQGMSVYFMTFAVQLCYICSSIKIHED